MADAGVKVCSVCGLDVSGKPRVKDAAGRYMCQDCLAKAKAARGAQTAPPPKPKPTTTAAPSGEDDNAFLLDIGGKGSVASQGVKPCPECGRALTEGSVVCVGCGYNSATGKRLQVKVQKAEKVKAEKRAGGGSSGVSPHLIGVGILAGFGLLAAGAVFMPAFGIVFMIAACGGILASRIWALFAAWQDETWKGVVILVGWFFGLLWLYELYYVAVEAENVLLKWLWFSSLLAGIGALVINFAMLSGAAP